MTLIGLATPLGLALAAPLGSLLGVHALLIIGGLLGAAVCLLGFTLAPLLRIEETDPGAIAASATGRTKIAPTSGVRPLEASE